MEKKMSSLRSNTTLKTVILPFIAEFVGHLLFCFTHSSTANTITVSTSASVKGNALLPATNDGLTVAALIWSLGHISGIHINFAVTIAVFIAGAIEWWKVPIYLVAQLLGSLCGASLSLAANGRVDGYFSVPEGSTFQQALLMEIMVTALLTLVILMTAVELKSPHAPLAIGLTIWVGIMASFNISSACLNPSLSFGLAAVSGQWAPDYWIFWIGPIIGAIVSGLLYRLFFSVENNILLGRASEDATADETEMTNKALDVEQETQ